MSTNPRVAEDRGVALAECVLALGVLLGGLVALGQRRAGPPLIGTGTAPAAVHVSHHPGLNPAP